MLTSARLENVARAVVAVKGWHSVEKTEINRNYQKSDLHQIIRILKNYGFLREPQMELFKVKRRRPRKTAPASPSVNPTEPADTLPQPETQVTVSIPAAPAKEAPKEATRELSGPEQHAPEGG